MVAETKTCKGCGEPKLLERFYGRKGNRDGLSNTCRTCEDVRSRAWQAANPERTRVTNKRTALRRYYGMTIEQYEEMLLGQDGRCACCGTDKPGGPGGTLHVDHNHRTGKVRGLICSDCNTGIGKLGDDLNGVANAMAYLQRADGAS